MPNSHQVTDKLFQNWCELLQNFDINQTAVEKTFIQIAEAYSTPNRYYHNLEHIHHVLEVIQTLQSQTEDLETETLQFAAWFHDIVYDSKAKNNEEKSAQYAAEFLLSLSIPSDIIKNVENLILATKNHQPINGDRRSPILTDKRLTQILLDADLAILSSNPKEYSKYIYAIRQEYIWVPELEYIAARKQILQNFLQRKNIYFTKLMQQTKDKIARNNLETEISLKVKGNFFL